MTFELPQNTRTPVRVRESIVAGAVPTVLAEGEVAVNAIGTGPRSDPFPVA